MKFARNINVRYARKNVAVERERSSIAGSEKVMPVRDDISNLGDETIVFFGQTHATFGDAMRHPLKKPRGGEMSGYAVLGRSFSRLSRQTSEKGQFDSTNGTDLHTMTGR